MVMMSAGKQQQQLLVLLVLLVSCRNVNTKTPGQTESPYPISPLQTVEKSFVLKGESHTERVQVLNPVHLALACTWAGNQKRAANITGSWRKDGEEVENSRVTVLLENEQYNLKKTFRVAAEDDLGSYACVFGGEAKIEFVLAVPQLDDVRDKPIVSYTGDTVVITCKMEKNKPKPNTWNWYRANDTGKEQIVPAAEPQRYEVTNEDRKTKLLVYNVTEADSGWFYCGAVYDISTAMGRVELKVISFLEPLKPFVAIVVEVIVLVVAFLLYERSHSKKEYTAAGNGTNDQASTRESSENVGAEENSAARQRKV